MIQKRGEHGSYVAGKESIQKRSTLLVNVLLLLNQRSINKDPPLFFVGESALVHQAF